MCPQKWSPWFLTQPRKDCMGWSSSWLFWLDIARPLWRYSCNPSNVMSQPWWPDLQLWRRHHLYGWRVQGSATLAMEALTFCLCLSGGGPVAHQGERCTLPTPLSGGSGEIEEEEKWWRRERATAALCQSKLDSKTSLNECDDVF